MKKELENQVFDEKNEFIKNVEDMYESIKNNSEKSYIEESVFVNEFLPYLVKGKDEKGITHLWMEIAGGPFNEVDIVKGGKHIGTVPPLMIMPELIKSTNSLPMNEISHTFAQKNSRLKSEADNYSAGLAAEIDKRVDVIENGLNEKWKELGIKYNVLTEETDKDHNSSGVDTDVFEY